MPSEVRRRPQRLLGGLAAAALALGSWGLIPLSAYAEGQAVSAGARTGADLTVARQVTLVQRVERQVTLHAQRDRRSRLSATGRDLWQISELGSFDVPQAALTAYQHAASRMAASDPGCHIPWTLLAGIGRVESDHGRYGGSVLGSDGVSRPLIIGIPLDGHGPVAAIHDTDHGRFDGDKVWDRAVGPMQFIPGTWASAGRDGDGNGVADPNDLDDAALAAADYLCSGSDLTDPDTMRAAILRYNASDYYAALVMAFEKGYRTGSFVIPSPPPPPGATTPGRRHHHGPSGHRGSKHAPQHSAHHAPQHHGGHSSGHPAGNGGGSVTPPPTPPPTPTPTPTPDPPQDQQKTGQLTACGGGWCLDGLHLDLGGASKLAAQAAADLDGDGTVESNADELTGLEGRQVQVTVRGGTDPAVVVQLEGHAY